jgi:predicted metalloprotease with PDZ domain
MRDGEGPGQRVLAHRPNARIHLRYRVIQDWEGPPHAQMGNTYRPVIQPGYFHLIGDASLVTPETGALDTPVRWRVRNVPRGWSLASDLEHQGLTLRHVWSSVTVGGDFRVLHDDASNVRLAIRGTWRFNDADFLNEAAHIISSQRRFWGDSASPYIVTVLQLEAPEGWISIGGTGLSDGFAFFATPNAEAFPITRTLAHESLHTWIPAAIGDMPEQGEAVDYWLSEGFTDFYTPRLLVRDGIWTPAQYAEDLNQMLRDYARSPARTAPNTRIAEEFWSDREVQRLPYQRGRLLAMIWDARLRAAGDNDFDNVVMEMRVRARESREAKAADLLPLAAHGLGLDIAADLTRFVEAGEFVLLPEDAVAPCGRIETREVPVFHRGFDIEATQANNMIIAGVDPSLPAYAAGLRDGMVLVRRDGGEIGDSQQEIAYVVRDGEIERTFRYMPRGNGAFTQQHLRLADNLEGDRLAQCVHAMGG